MGYELTDLRLFCHVVASGSITAGAERMHLSLPSASARIRALERHAGLPLLVRGRRGVRPTPAGTALARHAGDVLAGTARTQTGLHRRDVRPSILALLERLPQTAGFVMSAAFEVLAWNDLAAALMEDFAEVAPEDRNLARRAFLGPSRADAALYGISDAGEFKQHAAMQLRIAGTRYPSDPAVTGLIDELLAGSPEFTRLWQHHDVQAPAMLTKTFHHREVGPVTVDCDSLALTDRDQHLILYSAPRGSSSAEALALLSVIGTQNLNA